MESVTLIAAATAIATVVLTKSLEKVGENLGGVAWEKSIELVEQLRSKNQLPLLTSSVKENEQPRLNYGQAVLELKKAADTDPEIARKVNEVEVAAKADPTVAQKVQALEDEIKSQPATIINETKLAESIKNVFQGNTIIGGTF